MSIDIRRREQYNLRYVHPTIVPVVREHPRLSCVRGAVKLHFSKCNLTEGLSYIDFQRPLRAGFRLPTSPCAGEALAGCKPGVTNQFPLSSGGYIMSNIYTSVSQLIGGTPLLELCNIEKAEGLSARILAKVEGMNPAGSAKDRVGLSMIEDAEKKGLLKKGSTIIEPTSGNTGIGLCCVAAARGYHCIIVMPDSMSVERQKLMTAYGAQLVLTPGAGGMAAAIAKAEQLQKEIPGSMIAGQFVNPANPDAHYRTTGPEIWADTDGEVDIFVAGIGTGGTITGTGRYLKERNPNVKIIGMEPADSPLLTTGKAGPHGIQGIGANFVPEILDLGVVDEILTCPLEGAYDFGRRLGREEGILAGISSGGALWAAMEVAKRPENAGKTIVVLLPDSGERYLSTAMFA